MLKEPRRKPVNSLLRYLEGNKERMNYCERLRLGRVFGSGMVEGARKNLARQAIEADGSVLTGGSCQQDAVIVTKLYGKM